ncbi:hypothetical protein ANRL4_04825 [Anaerolineae bacterium]|nr:hypothetical protein ANRL4_04825 [Anaerolineae bacterium]
MDIEKQPYMVGKTCMFCGQHFLAKRCDAQFCSASCRGKFHRWRVKLRKLHTQILSELQEMSGYLRYENAKPSAVEAFKSVAGSIRDILASAGVRAVK